MRRSALILFAILAGALVLRLAHLYAVWPILGDQGAEVGMDRWLAMHVAEAVARGDWLGGWSADYDSAPGYAYLLGGLLRLTGEHWLPPLLVQCVLGALACALVFAIGRRLHSTTVGLLAAGLLAAYAPALFYETLLVKFSLVTVTMAALLCCVLAAGAQARLLPSLLGGLAFGLLVALRGNAVVLGVPCLWWLARGAAPSGLRGCALVAGRRRVAAAIAITPPPCAAPDVAVGDPLLHRLASRCRWYLRAGSRRARGRRRPHRRRAEACRARRGPLAARR
jgi:4-amino-4-deoxy-L-arabinose transferase-like glycosyltransferase